MTARVIQTTKTLHGMSLEGIDFDALIEAGEPVILKGVLSHTPLVTAAVESNAAAKAHLLAAYNNSPVLCYVAPPEAEGRFFYNQDMTGLNFKTVEMSLSTFFEDINVENARPRSTSFYVGSAKVKNHFPNLIHDDQLGLPGKTFENYPPRIGIWMGNRTIAATHFDMSNNVAACLVGERRFTLFPPSQIDNLYPGPLDPTPGGQVVSMFDLNNPDFQRYPRAKTALENAQIAEIEPGDMLVYPALWWHQVEAKNDFNVMINYWWNNVPSFVDDPMSTLLHALLSLRDRPDNEKQAWQHFFNYYVFDDADMAGEHIPEHIRGVLGPIDRSLSRRLRAKILRKMNR